jgi:hypothetical protein
MCDSSSAFSIALKGSSCVWNNGRLTFLSKSGEVGWTDLVFQATVDGIRVDSTGLKWRKLPSTPDRIVVAAGTEKTPLELVVMVEADQERDLLKVRCRYRNLSTRPVRLADVVEGVGQLHCSQGRAFHVENIKSMHIALDKDPNAIPGRVDYGTVLCGDSYWKNLGAELRYGQSEDQPFPALFLASPATGLGLVDAQLSQDRWYREVCLGGASDDQSYTYAAEMTTRGVSSVMLRANSAIDGEGALLQICGYTDVTRAFVDYRRELQSRYDFRAQQSPNREELIWGSWNLGIWAECTDELVVGNARVISEHFPRVRWVQIDEGWAAVPAGAMGCPLYEGHDRVKFPRGLAPVVADVKKLGLRPALWCGMHISPDARVVNEHPEWLLRNPDGSVHMAGRCVLDYSQEEVRDFLVQTYRTIIQDWGYEGIKLDFWTYGFEDHGMVYANDDRTSLELRNWWLSTLRGMLPEDGYLQLNCCLPSISPFVARFGDNIRYGVDIGVGVDWQPIVDTASWMAAESLFGLGTTWLPNSDAIGSMQEMDAAKKRTWLSYCGVTGSALELGGDLRQESEEDWRDAARILSSVRIGAEVRVLDFGTPEDPVPPTLWFSETGMSVGEPESFVGTLCAFNWAGNGVSRRYVSFEELGLPNESYRVLNYWTAEEKICRDGISIPDVPLHDVYAVMIHRMSE